MEALKARLIAENPGLGEVFEVFRGRIATVRAARGEQAAEEAAAPNFAGEAPGEIDLPQDYSDDASDGDFD